MTTTRFAIVVARCGRPEVFLLFDPGDPAFARALKESRIMTLVGQGSAAAFGEVGYSKSRQGQLLLFPKSLRDFAGDRIVGIKYELFADVPQHPPHAHKPEAKTKAPRVENKAAQSATQSSKPQQNVPPPRLVKGKPEITKKSVSIAEPVRMKIIDFPRKDEDEEDPEITELKNGVRRALRALSRRQYEEAARVLAELLGDQT